MQQYKFTLLLTVCFILAVPSVLSGQSKGEGVITGELKKWHKVTLTFTGPQTGEKGRPFMCCENLNRNILYSSDIKCQVAQLVGRKGHLY